MESWWMMAGLGIFIIVYAKWFLKDRSPSKRTDNAITKEMEETVTALSLQIKEDNERLIRRIKQMKEQTELKLKELEEKTESLAKQLKDKNDEGQAVEQKPAKHSLNIRSRYDHVLTLYHQNVPVSDIAKRTGIHEGEIRLIVRLARDEEAGPVVS